MPAKPEPSIAVIGCGHWGKNLVRNMHGLGAVASVHDRDPQTEAAIASKYGVPGRQWPEILDDDAIRGVVIAAPAAALKTSNSARSNVLPSRITGPPVCGSAA